MEVKFKVYETPQPKDRKGKPLYHARLMPRGSKNIYDICEFVSNLSSFSAADVKGILEALFKYITMEMCDGYNVELENFGHFSIALKSKQIINGKGRKLIKTTVDGVNFRCSPRLKKEIKKSHLKKMKNRTLPFPDQQIRKKRMIEYLETKGSINLSRYKEINGCTYYCAQKDIQTFLKEEAILPLGVGTHRVYLLAEA